MSALNGVDTYDVLGGLKPMEDQVSVPSVNGWTADFLREYEDEIAAMFNAGKIKSPVHLAGGNEDQLIKIFEKVEHDDWVLCSWRAHYHCLLKGVPEKELTAAILRGRSIGLCFPKYRVLSSAIVGGIAPIAVGIGGSIKKSQGHGTVHVFIGDMTAETGIVHEAIKYATGHDLPVKWYVEDNGRSVCTPTRKVWGEFTGPDGVERYVHDLTRPHVGTGMFVRF